VQVVSYLVVFFSSIDWTDNTREPGGLRALFGLMRSVIKQSSMSKV
jgi:hypothetical protein